MLASSQKAPNSVGSFATRAEVPPSSKSDSKLPVTYSTSSTRSPKKFIASPTSTRNQKINSKTIESLKEGIGELGKKIETMKKEQKSANYLASLPNSSEKQRTMTSAFEGKPLLSPERDDALTVLKQEFQQIGVKAEKIQQRFQQQVTSTRAASSATAASHDTQTPLSKIEAEDSASNYRALNDGKDSGVPIEILSEIPTESNAMRAEILLLRKAIEQEKRLNVENAAEIQETRANHEASMRDINKKLTSLESLVSEKNTEVS